MSQKKKLYSLYIASFIVSVLPLIIVVAFNFEHYTKTPKSTISLTVGGVMALILMGLKAINKLPKIASSPIKIGIVLLIVCLLEPLILDLKLFLVALFIGATLDSLIFSGRIKNLKEEIMIDKTSTATAEKIEQVLKNLGRV